LLPSSRRPCTSKWVFWQLDQSGLFPSRESVERVESGDTKGVKMRQVDLTI
jgi:hypothetical protein